MVENIRDSVTSYYSQFEETPAAMPDEAEAEAAGSDPPPEETVAETAAEKEQEAESIEEFIAEGAPAPPPEEIAAATESEPAPSIQDPAPSSPEPQDVEIAGESDTIIDSGRVSNDESEADGSQNE